MCVKVGGCTHSLQSEEKGKRKRRASHTKGNSVLSDRWAKKTPGLRIASTPTATMFASGVPLMHMAGLVLGALELKLVIVGRLEVELRVHAGHGETHRPLERRLHMAAMSKFMYRKFE